MNYEQTLEYLYAKLPMYQRIGAAAYKKDLTNTIRLCEALGNPQNQFKSIHIAGTNGKGSTSHILSAIYQANGYKVGLYTSPHLVDFRERIKINGGMCSKKFVVNFTQRIAPLIEEIQPSFFEITVAMAFAYFAEKQVDIAIIETGLGGRLDSTNVITPIACIITSIGYDHMDMLGDTLELIAAEKAGIIKANTPTILGKLPEEAEEVMLAKAKEMKASVFIPIFKQQLTLDLLGKHQQHNASLALKCIEINQHQFPTSDDTNAQALQRVCELTNFEGRWQTLNKLPLVICDVGHNEEGFKAIVQELSKIEKKKICILGFVQGKDLEAIKKLLPKNETYFIVKPTIFRGRDQYEVSEDFAANELEAKAFPNLKMAVEDAYGIANTSQDEWMIFIGGSNFVVADLLELRNKNQLPFQK